MPGKRINPFEEKTGIVNYCYSKRCQKLITDFGIEESFQSASIRMKEHHGVEINLSAVRKITEFHAERAAKLEAALPKVKQRSRQMIAEMDGEMVPLVEYESSEDRRKTKKILWSELRVGVAQNINTVTWEYACSFKNAEELGIRLKTTMLRLGFDDETKVHGVGDGACWIPEQGEKIAGKNYEHLIDLYHLSEYFSGAVSAWQEDTKKETKRLKEMAEAGHINDVVKELKTRRIEFPSHEGLRVCIQYIENRPGQFNYKEAHKKGLPVGSGKIESTHRSLMQKRLKKPGAWWLRDNASKMADLRTLRANGGWEFLWQQKSQANLLQTAA